MKVRKGYMMDIECVYIWLYGFLLGDIVFLGMGLNLEVWGSGFWDFGFRGGFGSLVSWA